jgi:hypothetical protein
VHVANFLAIYKRQFVKSVAAIDSGNINEIRGLGGLKSGDNQKCNGDLGNQQWWSWRVVNEEYK